MLLNSEHIRPLLEHLSNTGVWKNCYQPLSDGKGRSLYQSGIGVFTSQTDTFTVITGPNNITITIKTLEDGSREISGGNNQTVTVDRRGALIQKDSPSLSEFFLAKSSRDLDFGGEETAVLEKHDAIVSFGPEKTHIGFANSGLIIAFDKSRDETPRVSSPKLATLFHHLPLNFKGYGSISPTEVAEKATDLVAMGMGIDPRVVVTNEISFRDNLRYFKKSWLRACAEAPTKFIITSSSDDTSAPVLMTTASTKETIINHAHVLLQIAERIKPGSKNFPKPKTDEIFDALKQGSVVYQGGQEWQFAFLNSPDEINFPRNVRYTLRFNFNLAPTDFICVGAQPGMSALAISREALKKAHEVYIDTKNIIAAVEHNLRHDEEKAAALERRKTKQPKSANSGVSQSPSEIPRWKKEAAIYKQIRALRMD